MFKLRSTTVIKNQGVNNRWSSDSNMFVIECTAETWHIPFPLVSSAMTRHSSCAVGHGICSSLYSSNICLVHFRNKCRNCVSGNYTFLRLLLPLLLRCTSSGRSEDVVWCDGGTVQWSVHFDRDLCFTLHVSSC